MKQSITSLDGQKVLVLKDWLLNPLTTAQVTALGATLGVVNKGLAVFDTDLLVVKFWNGTAFVSGVSPLVGAMTYKGTTASLTVAPATTVDGDTYYYSGAAGTLTWAGITFNPSGDVQPGDILIQRDATNWDVVQGNTVQATEVVQGTAKVATQVITNAAVNDTDIVTPVKLEARLVNRGITLVAGTPFAITFPSVSSNKDAFIVSVKDSAGNEVICDVDANTTAGFNITSDIAIAGVTVFTTYL
jgi:hypothetical protein